MPEIRLPILNSAQGKMTPADALIGANVVLRGGLFAEGEYRDAALFMDLCTLIESSILHERLLCLPTGVPHGTEELSIVDTLIKEGILWKLEVDNDEFTSKAAISILSGL